MKSLRNIIILTAACCFLWVTCICCCQEYQFLDRDAFLSIKNNSKDTIYCDSYYSHLKPDTLTVMRNFYNRQFITKVAPGEISELMNIGRYTTLILNNRNQSRDYNFIFILSKDTIDKYGLEEAKKRHMYDTLYVIRTSEIIKRDFLIPYPLEN